MAEALGNNSYLIDTGLYGPAHGACYLVEDSGELAIIDTGTHNSLPQVLETIAAVGATPQKVRYVIPTHVHLDHAGGAGQLMDSCPNATLVVHPKGLRMIDPSKLQAGAIAVYGEEAFQRDFGDLKPVPEERTVAASDLQDFELGGRGAVSRHPGARQPPRLHIRSPQRLFLHWRHLRPRVPTVPAQRIGAGGGNHYAGRIRSRRLVREPRQDDGLRPGGLLSDPFRQDRPTGKEGGHAA